MSDQPPTGTPTPVPNSQEQQQQTAPPPGTAEFSDQPPAGTPPTPGPNTQEQPQAQTVNATAETAAEKTETVAEMAESAAEKADFLERLSKFRDGLLVAGGLLYVLGYAVWSINAWRSGLGILPALEFQYLVAGIIPAAILGGMFYFIRVLWGKIEPLKRGAQTDAKSGTEAQAEVERWTSEKATGIVFSSLAVVGAVAVALYFILRWLDSLPDFAKPIEHWGSGALTVTIVAFMVILSIVPRWLSEHYKPGTFKNLLFHPRYYLTQAFHRRPTARVIVTLIPSISGVMIIGLWVWAYPYIPQALGGVQPRCAQLDLARKDVSADTLKAVVSNPTTTPAAAPSPEAGAAAQAVESVVRTDEVQVLFSGSDYMLIKARDGRVYEIKKDVVQAVVVQAVAACAKRN